VIALAIAHILAHSRLQIASKDRVVAQSFVVVLPPGSRLCQADEIFPPDTADLRMTIGTYYKPGPRLVVTVAAGGRRLASGGLSYGWRQGRVLIPISPQLRGTYSSATVCISNRGRTQVALAGSNIGGDYGFADYLNGTFLASEVSIDYMLPGKPSWFDMLSTLGYRMTLGKGSYVGWLGWVGPLLLMVGATVLAVRLMLAEERDS